MAGMGGNGHQKGRVIGQSCKHPSRKRQQKTIDLQRHKASAVDRWKRDTAKYLLTRRRLAQASMGTVTETSAAGLSDAVSRYEAGDCTEGVLRRETGMSYAEAVDLLYHRRLIELLEALRTNVAAGLLTEEEYKIITKEAVV